MEPTLCGRCGRHVPGCKCDTLRREVWQAAADYCAGDAQAAARLSMTDAAYVLDNLASVFRALARNPEAAE